jgi:C4-dicarboxylate transporter, DctM subunit
VPGITLATLLALVTWTYAKRNRYPRMPRATWAQRFHAFRESLWGLLLIGIVLGGIYSGLFTPTEAAAVAAVYAFVIAVFVYKDLPLSRVPKVLLNAANLSAMLLYIITNAVLFSFLMTHENIPQAMAAWMISKQFSPWVFLLIMAPILFPIITKLGIDPVHFGILMAVNMEVGLCHPPVGLNLYVASGIAKMGISELTMAVLPWLITMLCFLALVTYWPALSLWFPHLLGIRY